MSELPSTVVGMKIYRITVQGSTKILWTNYQSATQSYGCWDRKYPGQVELEAVHVPDDAWKPVDRAAETRLNRVAVLWEQLTVTDPEGLDALLDELVKRVSPPVKKKPVLSEAEKTEAMLKLDQLVDAA